MCYRLLEFRVLHTKYANKCKTRLQSPNQRRAQTNLNPYLEDYKMNPPTNMEAYPLTNNSLPMKTTTTSITNHQMN